MHFWLPCLCIGLLGNRRQKKNIHNEAKMLLSFDTAEVYCQHPTV